MKAKTITNMIGTILFTSFLLIGYTSQVIYLFKDKNEAYNQFTIFNIILIGITLMCIAYNNLATNPNDQSKN